MCNYACIYIVLDLKRKVVLNPDNGNMSDVNNTKIKLSILHDQEESYWHHKATTKFVVEGDRNTHLFSCFIQ